MGTIIRQLKIRRDTTASWSSANPILAEGEIGVDTDTEVFKVGDGVTAWNSLNSNIVFNAPTLNLPTLNSPVFGAGSADANSKPKFQSGTLLTAAEAGALEYDGSVFYASPKASNRAVIPTYYMIRQDATYTLTSSTAVQKLFNASANGRVSLNIGTYRFQCQYYLTGMSGTSGNSSFSLATSGAVIGAIQQIAFGHDAAAATTAATSGSGIVTGAFPASQHTAGTGVTQSSFITGTFEVTTAGFIIPSIQLVTAAAAVVNIGSYFECWPVSGATNFTTIGNWS